MTTFAIEKTTRRIRKTINDRRWSASLGKYIRTSAWVNRDETRWAVMASDHFMVREFTLKREAKAFIDTGKAATVHAVKRQRHDDMVARVAARSAATAARSAAK